MIFFPICLNRLEYQTVKVCLQASIKQGRYKTLIFSDQTLWLCMWHLFSIKKKKRYAHEICWCLKSKIISYPVSTSALVLTL